MPNGHWFVGLGVALFVGGSLLLALWPRMAPYVPQQQEARLHAIADENGTVTFTGGTPSVTTFVGRAVLPPPEDQIVELIDAPLPLSRIRDAGGFTYYGPKRVVHRACVEARRDGGEVCDRCSILAVTSVKETS